MTVTVRSSSMPNAEYHADLTADSHSSLQLFRESRERYEAERITQTLERDPPTPAKLFGSLVHTVVLEPEAFELDYIVWQKVPGQGDKAREKFAATYPDKVCCTDIEYAAALAMREGVMRNRHARAAIEAEGITEKPIFWQDPATSLLLKCKPDRRLAKGVLVDLKTTDDVSPDGFGRTVNKYGYHNQAALYLSGVAQETGDTYDFIFIAVSKTPPHETVVHILEGRALLIGSAANRSTLTQLRACRESGDFSGEWAGDIQTCNLPSWAYYRKELQ